MGRYCQINCVVVVATRQSYYI